MMAEHGTPCDPQEATFCMNEGACYKLPAMNTLSCICSENYKGIRCEQYHLPSSSQDGHDRGLLAAIIVVAIILLVVLVVIIYYVQKMVKEKNKPKEGWRSDEEAPTIVASGCISTGHSDLTSQKALCNFTRSLPKARNARTNANGNLCPCCPACPCCSGLYTSIGSPKSKTS